MSQLPGLQVPEAQVQNAILDYLAYRADVVLFWRHNVGAAVDTTPGRPKRYVQFGKAGQADILGMLEDGRFLAIECKSTSGRLTRSQLEFLNRVNLGGGVALVARSVEDVARVLDGEER